MSSTIDWGDDSLLRKLERDTDRDPTKYNLMLTIAEANQAAAHIRKLRAEVAHLMTRCEVQERALERISEAIPDDDDIYELAGLAQDALSTEGRMDD